MLINNYTAYLVASMVGGRTFGPSDLYPREPLKLTIMELGYVFLFENKSFNGIHDVNG